MSECYNVNSRPDMYSLHVEPPNRGHIGDNIYSFDLSFVDRLSFFGG